MKIRQSPQTLNPLAIRSAALAALLLICGIFIAAVPARADDQPPPTCQADQDCTGSWMWGN